jgi:hypothetical protein
MRKRLFETWIKSHVDFYLFFIFEFQTVIEGAKSKTKAHIKEFRSNFRIILFFPRCQ